MPLVRIDHPAGVDGNAIGAVVHRAFTVVQITCNRGRSLQQKQALYAAIARQLKSVGSVSAADILINLIEVDKENWSFGEGLAQYA